MIFKFLPYVVLIFALLECVRSQDVLLESGNGSATLTEELNELEEVLNITNANNLTIPLILPPSLSNINDTQIRNLRARKEIKKLTCSFKCIISDLDGTLAEAGSRSIAEPNLSVIGDILLSNIRFFPATGKSFTSSMKFITNNLKNTIFNGFPGVYYNGALVLGPGGANDVLFDTRISSANALEIVKYIKKFALSNEKSLRFEDNKSGNAQYIKILNKEGNEEETADLLRLLNIAIETPSGLYVDGFEGENMKEYMSYEMNDLVHKGVNLSKFLEPREGEKTPGLFKILIAEDPRVLLHLREHLETFVKIFGCKVHRSVPNVLEIIPHNASKLNGAKLILKKLKIHLNQVAYLGDSENDIEIMAKVGYPVATIGSSPAVSYVSRASQTFSPETSFSSIINEYCSAADCKKN